MWPATQWTLNVCSTDNPPSKQDLLGSDDTRSAHTQTGSTRLKATIPALYLR
jgi:hypothetical protein